IFRNRREQVIPPVQTISGAPTYLPGLRALQEEAFRVANRISPNLDEESSEVNREIQIQQQEVTINNTQNEQRQQVDVIDLEQNIQQQTEDISGNEPGNINNVTEYQEDFLNEPQQLEIRILNKKNKKHKHGKHQRSVGQSPWTIVQLDELSGTAREGPDQSHTKLRSRQPTCRRQWIVLSTQTNPQSQITPNLNQNQSSILNVDRMGIFTNPFSVPKGIQHQQNAGEAAQVQHAHRETFSTNGNVRKVASSTDSLVSGQVGVAGTKPINKQTAPSTQLQVDPIREPKVEKKGGR
ncbi:MAG: hypothetical protein EZS28_049200, partial [Streblomastix strix]